MGHIFLKINRCYLPLCTLMNEDTQFIYEINDI